MKNFEMWKFPTLKPQEVQAMDEVLGRGVPKLLEQVEHNVNEMKNADENNPFFSNDQNNPFDTMAIGKSQWIVTQTQKQDYDQRFYSLSLTNGKASGGQIKQIMLQSQLSNAVLGKIWQLSDIDKDGNMTDQEFALCCFLIDHVKKGNKLPDILPDDYIPPSYRAQIMKQRMQQNQQQSSQQQNSTNTTSTSSGGGGGGLPPPNDSVTNGGGGAW